MEYNDKQLDLLVATTKPAVVKLFLVFFFSMLGSSLSAQHIENRADLQKTRTQKLTALQQGDSLSAIDRREFKSAVVVFYKTDCPYCERLMPLLKKLHEAYGDKGFQVFAICLDEDTAAWERYVHENGYDRFANYCDGKSYMGPLADAYHVFATPSLFLVDGNWKIAAKPKGPEALNTEIEKMCSK